MPRECIPQHELVWLYAKPQQSAPYNRCRRFGKPVWTFLRFAGAPRINVGEEIIGIHADLLASPKQDPLRSHGDSAEVTTAITNGFANNHELGFAKAFLQLST